MRIKHLVGLLLVLVFVIASTGNAVKSSVSITRGSRGEFGPDKAFKADQAKIYADQRNDRATRTLYVGAQKQGYGWTGGVVFNRSVSAGKHGSKTGTLTAGGHHVILDPEGPGLSGCEGSGYLSQS